MATRSNDDPCPTRHPQPIIGTCRKQVCDACAGLKTREKVICKFCFAELKEHDKPKREPTEFEKFLGFFGIGRRGAPKAKLESCTGGAHVQEAMGSCQICRKSICPACVSEKKLSGQPVCMACFESLFQIRDQVKLEEQRRFTGGLKGFANFSLFVATALLLVSLALTGVLAGTLTLFHLLYPASFVTFKQNWSAGRYDRMVTRDVPDLCYEIYERIWYEWWYEEGLRMPYEQWKQEQREAAGVAAPDPGAER